MGRETEAARTRFIQISNYPGVLLAVLVGIGISLESVAPCWPGWWLAFSAVGLVAAMVWRKSAWISSSALAFGVIAIALADTQIQLYRFPSDSVANFTTDDPRFAQLECSLEQTPRIEVPSPKELRALPPKQIGYARVRRIRGTSGWESASGRILLSIEQPNVALRAGQVIRLTGMLERPLAPGNPGEFDWAAWCRENRILTTFRVTHADGVQILEEHFPGPAVWLREKTRHLLARGFTLDDEANHALLRAFVLGDSDPQLRDLEDKLVRTGTVHLMSISGLHIAVVGGLVLLIGRLLRVTPRTALYAALAVVLLYAMVALPSWPGWRSILLFAGATVGIAGRRWANSLHMLGLSVAAVLFIQPSDLGNGGFQVSLAAVLGLILFSNRVTSGFWLWWRGPDPILPGDIPHSAWRNVWFIPTRFFLGALIASLVAWAMVMPLIAYHFGQMNLWSVAAGVGLLPLTAVALVAGVAKIILTLLWPSGAHLWAIASVQPILLLQHAIDALDKLPGASIQMARPEIWSIAAYYALLLLAFVPFHWKPARWLFRVGPVATCAWMLLPSIPAHTNVATPGAAGLRITLLSIGAGQCCVVEPSPGRVDLFDVGSSTISDVMDAVLEPYLRDQACFGVEGIYLSHGDFDHISAAGQLFDAYTHPPVFISPHFARHAVGNYPAEALLQRLTDAGCPPTLIHRGDTESLGHGVSVEVLWPPVDCPMNSNNCGVVMKLHFADRTVLFTADIQAPPEEALLKDPSQLKADILIAPHHGSAETTTAAFIRAVNPDWILASSALKLTHKQKVFDAIAAHYRFYRTSRCGAITVSIDPSGRISVDSFLGLHPDATVMAGATAEMPIPAQ
jgi:competence protein ComEC